MVSWGLCNPDLPPDGVMGVGCVILICHLMVSLGLCNFDLPPDGVMGSVQLLFEINMSFLGDKTLLPSSSPFCSQSVQIILLII